MHRVLRKCNKKAHTPNGSEKRLKALEKEFLAEFKSLKTIGSGNRNSFGFKNKFWALKTAHLNESHFDGPLLDCRTREKELN